MDTISAEESLERATADVELLLSAYSEEARAVNATVPPHSLPLHVQLLLSQTASLTLEFTRGYPVETAVLIHSYRCQAHEKARLEATVTAVREAALHALEDQTEGGFLCCATARETWETASSEEAAAAKAAAVDASPSPANVPPWAEHHVWITSETTLTDRKSVFQAHVCRIGSESNVRPALVQLLDGNSKLQRASHNMWAYRIREASAKTNSVLKHDNDDDGEDGAGSRLAHLLEMRQEDGVLVLVSRWFGGIHLGPKRFAHISNVARDLLVQCHNDGTLSSAKSAP